MTGTPATLNPRVFGKYEVIRRIAIGGMGEIYLARQTGVAGFDRLVILKSLLPQLAEDQEQLGQFLDEARILGSMNHPNVCALLEAGAWEGVYFIAMEYIDGVDTAALIKDSLDQHVRFPVLVAAQIVRDAALGLDSAHHTKDPLGRDLGVVHRDISPHNLMVRADGVTKVVDFGVAMAVNRSQKTEAGLLKGKLGYMSPEQIKGSVLDARHDQYALGVLLWEMCTCRRLFVGENPAQVFMQILRDKIPPPSSLMADVPAELDAIVLRMTAPEPADRFPRLADAALALKRFLEVYRALDDGVAKFVRGIVGEKLAERTRDLSPVPVQIAGLVPPSRGPSTGSRCGACGAASVSGDRFCRVCGASLGLPVTRTPTPVADRNREKEDLQERTKD